MATQEAPFVHADEALSYVDAIPDPRTRTMVHQGLVDLLSLRWLLPGETPHRLDMLEHARCLEAAFEDPRALLDLLSGRASPVDPRALETELREAENAGAIVRGAEAFRHCQEVSPDVVRELTCYGLARALGYLVHRAEGAPAVDMAVECRLFETTFGNTALVRRVLEGREPPEWI